MHHDDINAVDWSEKNPNLVVTGSNDNRVCLLDIRKLSDSSSASGGQSAVINVFKGHTEPIQSVQFSPFSSRFLASSAESLKIWDLQATSTDDQLYFDHIGHINKITNFSWNKESDWTIMSASDDFDEATAGCSLQIYRPVDLLVKDK